MSELIETLVTSEGRNEGEAIGSWGRSIVFMPKGTPIGKQVCVRLIELAKKDSRGRTMYRAEPGPSAYLERWRDNGDGTASNVAFERDWLFEEHEVEVLETRTFVTREGTPTTRSDYRIAWGNSLVTSVVEDHQVAVIPTEQEYVFNNLLLWKKVSERTEPRPMFRFPITELRISNMSDWWIAKYEVIWNPTLSILVQDIFFQTSGGQVLRTSLNTTFGDMPDWWKREQEAKFPVCSCGRKRRDAQTPDGYVKCEQCR